MSEVILSRHEKGFWQADLYCDGYENGVSPDWYCTGKKDDGYDGILKIVKEMFPDAELIIADDEYDITPKD